MSYCPRCLTEYVAGVAECEDCHLLLQPGIPPERAAEPDDLRVLGDVKLVRVRIFSGPTAVLDADVARNILRTRGIPSVVPGQVSVEMLPVLDVPLLVREQDLARAEEMLKSYLDTAGPIPVE